MFRHRMKASSVIRGVLRRADGRGVGRRGGAVALGSVGMGVLLGAAREPARAEHGCCADWGWAGVALAATLAVHQSRSDDADTLQGKMLRLGDAAQDARDAAANRIKQVVSDVGHAEARVHKSRDQDGINHHLDAHELGKAIHLSSMDELMPSRSTMLIVGAYALGVVTGVLVFRAKAKTIRFRTVDDIPSSYFAEAGTKSLGRSIRGKVASVTDGDTFRLWHKPPMNDPLGKKAGNLSETSMMIRIAAVDTPETAKFGKEGQPFGEEAKQELTRLLDGAGTSLKVWPQARDQYGRAVCLVSIGRWPFTRDVAELMLEKGLATVYRQGGAQYGGKLERYEQIETAAKQSKRGMWSLGKKLETAAEYKKRTAN